MQRSRKAKAFPQAANPAAALEAYQRVEPQLASLTAAELVPVTVDVPAAVTTVLAAAPAIRAYRDDIAIELPRHPAAHVDQLEAYALAALYTHLVYTHATGGEDTAKALLEEAGKLREGLLIAAEALAHRELLDKDKIAAIRKGHGHADLASDLAALAALYRTQWSRIAGRTAVEQAEVDRAARLAPELVIALSARKLKGKDGGDAADRRARAFTLLVRAYDGCRRALTYVRWNEADVEAIAPSIFAKKRGRKPGSGKGADAKRAEASEGAEVEAEAAEPESEDAEPEPAEPEDADTEEIG